VTPNSQGVDMAKSRPSSVKASVQRNLMEEFKVILKTLQGNITTEVELVSLYLLLA